MALEMLLDKLAFLSDVTLIASGKRFTTHKGTLATFSDFFLNAFKAMPEMTELKVPESAEELTLALSHMYVTCGPLPITLDNVRGLVAFFSKYDVPKGLSACDIFLSASVALDDGNVPEWIVLADQHKLTFFLERCVRYVARHLSRLPKPETWMEQLLPATLTTLVRPHSSNFMYKLTCMRCLALSGAPRCCFAVLYLVLHGPLNCSSGLNCKMQGLCILHLFEASV